MRRVKIIAPPMISASFLPTRCRQPCRSARPTPPLPYGYPGTPAPASTGASTGSAGASATGTTPAGSDPTDATFVPVFREAVVTDGVTAWNLNHDYFASQQTAQWIANRYGTGKVISTPFEGTGGPFNADQSEFQIVLADGRTVNAGILAGYYERNPPAQFPGLADQLIRSQLGLNPAGSLVRTVAGARRPHVLVFY